MVLEIPKVKIQCFAMNGEVLFCVVGKIGYGKHLYRDDSSMGYDSYKEPIYDLVGIIYIPVGNVCYVWCFTV